MGLLLKGGTIVTGYPVSVFQADILIVDDRIERVAPNIEITSAEEFKVVDCSQMLITPGFVNGHIHLNQLLNRGFLEDVSTEDLLQNMHARHEKKSDDDRYWASLVSIYEGLRSGTTFFSAFATSSGRIGDAMIDAGVRGTLTVAKKDQWWGEGNPPPQKPTQQVLAGLQKQIEEWSSPTVTLSIGAASDRSASESLLRGLAQLASSTGVRLYIHTAEGSQSVPLSLKYRNARPVEFLSKINFLQPYVTLVHASNITEYEIQLIADSGASVCHCPISNAKTVAGIMPLKLVRGAGIPVCLGTDAASTGNTNNILVEGYFASILHRALSGDASFPPAEEVFAMLTVEGAKAVGFGGVLGEIRPGFKADVVLWNRTDSAFLPNAQNPIAGLIYCASEVRPERVYIDGALVYEKGPTRFDVNAGLKWLEAYARQQSPNAKTSHGSI